MMTTLNHLEKLEEIRQAQPMRPPEMGQGDVVNYQTVEAHNKPEHV